MYSEIYGVLIVLALWHWLQCHRCLCHCHGDVSACRALVRNPRVAVVYAVDRHYSVFSWLYVSADCHLLFHCVAVAYCEVMAVLCEDGHHTVVIVECQSCLYCRLNIHIARNRCCHSECGERFSHGGTLNEPCAGGYSLYESLWAICVRGSCRSPCVYDHLLPEVEAVLHVRVEVVESEESVTISVPSPVDMIFPVGISVDNKRVSAICCRLSEVQHRIALLQLLVYHIHPLFVGV